MQTVLIADDEPGIRNLIQATLESSECRVLQAADGARALACARFDRPDLVILDWMMPKLTGPEVAERLRADATTADVPIILLTGLNEERHRQRGATIGALAYLVKPFSPLQLLKIVDHVLSERNKKHGQSQQVGAAVAQPA
jgi:two-component system phosphate regulon response regulator PhoB